MHVGETLDFGNYSYIVLCKHHVKQDTNLIISKSSATWYVAIHISALVLLIEFVSVEYENIRKKGIE